MEQYKLRRRAIIYDFVCIAIALCVLFAANCALLPMWALITGATIAALFMVLSIVSLVKSARLLKQEQRKALERMRQPADEPASEEEVQP
ncbi:MAG: hypothetical protein IJ808_00860 [Muribaculaceae bacterium]|nr:hypothetical protein [Muribaculaceae bacterium]